MATEPTAFLCSYPKSGRTWMRFALVNLMNDVYGLRLKLDMDNMFSLIPNEDGGPDEVFYSQPWKTLDKYAFADREEMPFVGMSHLRWEGRFTGPRIVFLVRNPADVLVSLYFHMTRHAHQFEGTIGEFARDERYGVPRMVSYLSSWQPHLRDPNVTVMTYEKLKADPLDSFQDVVAGLGIEAGAGECRAALDAASVERMRKVEAKSGVGQPNAYDFDDPDARRVRRAKVGGWREEMDDDTIALMLAEIESDPAALELLEELDLMPGPAAV